MKDRPRARPPAPEWSGRITCTLAVLSLVAFLALDPLLPSAASHWPEWLQGAAQSTTNIVELKPLLIIAGIITLAGVVLRRLPVVETGIYAAFSALFASGVTHALKPLIGRARPPLFATEGLFGRLPMAGFDYESFPSGHATHAGAFFAALAFAMPRYRGLFLLLALWFAATRLVLGVHYPSDVGAGLVVGLGAALLTARLFARAGHLFRQ